jgi:hypothetical protein
MKKLKGPALKMPRLKTPRMKTPQVKTPDFLNDLYYDLRDRRLLPFVALVLVAIAAVPFLLGGDGEEVYVPGPSEGLSALGAEKTSKLTVVEATPGLRDYHQRLGDRAPTNPFKQRFTGLPPSAQVQSSSSGSETVEGSSTTTVTEGTTTEPSEGATSGGQEGGGSGSGGGSGGGSGKGRPPRLIQFVVDVQITHSETTADGKRQMSEPEVRDNVRPLTQLPGKKAPVVTAMGINLHNGKVMWLVSDEVKSLDGEFACAARTATGLCELLEIEPGFPLELVYGPNNVLYRIKVTKIDAVWDGRAGDKRSSRGAFVAPPRAALPTP